MSELECEWRDAVFSARSANLMIIRVRVTTRGRSSPAVSWRQSRVRRAGFRPLELEHISKTEADIPVLKS